MKAIIFGANGQDGHYLSKSCQNRNITVLGVSRKGPWVHGNVASREFVENIVKCERPDIIFHLAASSTTKHEMIFENHATIGEGTLNILDSVLKYSPESKVFITGSGLQFKNRNKPISESDIFGQSSGYVAVRNYSVYLARYFRSLNIKVYVGYLFHHESPLRHENHVSQKIVSAAQRISKGSDEIIEIGDLSIKKEWTYAADIAEGIMTLVEQENIYEATIGSGVAYSIGEWVRKCFKYINKDSRNYIKQKSDFPIEYPLLVSNPSTINSLGWRTRTSFEDLISIMMSHKNKNTILS